MKTPDTIWTRLVNAARSLPDESDYLMPHGFAARVVHRAFSDERASLSALIESLTFRALGIATLLTLAALIASYSLFESKTEHDFGTALNDPVTEILKITEA